MDYGLYVILGLFVTAMAATSVMFSKMMKEQIKTADAVFLCLIENLSSEKACLNQ